MAEIIEQALARKKSRGGRPNRLRAQDMILMTLAYDGLSLLFWHTHVIFVPSFFLSEQAVSSLTPLRLKLPFPETSTPKTACL